jgi:hypothetical protein
MQLVVFVRSWRRSTFAPAESVSVVSGFGADLGPKSVITSRILKSFPGPFGSAEIWFCELPSLREAGPSAGRRPAGGPMLMAS